MKNTILNRYNALLTCVLSFLGFTTACDSNNSMVVEYGTPHSTFIVQGTVSSGDDRALENIQVSTIADTVLTDAFGNYEIQQTDVLSDIDIQIQFKDIDGEENGHFETLDTVVQFNDAEFTGGDGSWDNGETEQTLNIELKTKE